MRIPCLALALVALASGPAALAQSYEIRNRDTDPSAVYHIKVFDGLNVRPSASFVSTRKTERPSDFFAT